MHGMQNSTRHARTNLVYALTLKKMKLQNNI